MNDRLLRSFDGETLGGWGGRLAPVLCAVGLMVGACAGPQGAGGGGATPVGAFNSAAITLDGDIQEWPDGVVMTANEHFLYIRFTVEDEQFTLQGAPQTTAVYLDLDADTSTGQKGTSPALASMGVDLEIEFSPRGKDGAGHGVAVYAVDESGSRTDLSTADLDFSFAPTYASSWYELRISRTPENAAMLPRAGMLSEGLVRGVVATLESDGSIGGYTDPFSAAVGRAAETKSLATVWLPRKPEGTVRVMSYNVEKSSPLSKPEQFRRVFQAIKPDVILLEEWEIGDAASVQAWFTALVSNGEVWNVRKAEGDNSNGGGVAIVTRYPMSPMSGDTLTTPSAKGGVHHVRFIGGKIVTPVGDLVTGAMHLKCCGTKDSVEDQTRMSEARAINACVASSASLAPGAMRLLAGDLNLVGSRPPLDLVRANLDADGSDLAVAEPMVLGDTVGATWRDAPTGYAPGRLDYLMYSSSNMRIVNAFVLDTARLSDEALARLGMDRGDCEGSDHLPVVVDLRPGSR